MTRTGHEGGWDSGRGGSCCRLLWGWEGPEQRVRPNGICGGKKWKEKDLVRPRPAQVARGRGGGPMIANKVRFATTVGTAIDRWLPTKVRNFRCLLCGERCEGVPRRSLRPPTPQRMEDQTTTRGIWC